MAGYVPDSMYTATQTLVLSGPPDDQLDDENDPFTSTNTEVHPTNRCAITLYASAVSCAI